MALPVNFRMTVEDRIVKLFETEIDMWEEKTETCTTITWDASRKLPAIITGNHYPRVIAEKIANRDYRSDYGNGVTEYSQALAIAADIAKKLA